MTTPTLISTRSRIKSHKPQFRRQDSHKKVRVKSHWRKSRGHQTKMGYHRRGYARSPTKGWRSPSAVRGALRSGLFPVVVSSVGDFTGLSVQTHGIIIASAVGSRKRIELIEYAISKGFTLALLKDPVGLVKELKGRVTDRVAAKKERTMKRARAQKEAEKKKTPEKETEEKTQAIDEKIKAEDEKKQKDKVLITKE